VALSSAGSPPTPPPTPANATSPPPSNPTETKGFGGDPKKRLAVPRPGTDGADFIDIVTFDKLASTCAEWLTKGREVAVVGKLRLSEWTSRDGEKRSRIQVVADAVQFLGSPKKTGDPDGGVSEPADTPAVGAYRRKAS
jgi:single-stranded DNA-binding protein